MEINHVNKVLQRVGEDKRLIQLIGNRISKDILIKTIFQYLFVKEQVNFCISHRTTITAIQLFQAVETRKKQIYERLEELQRTPYTDVRNTAIVRDLNYQVLGIEPVNLEIQENKVKFFFDEANMSVYSLISLNSLRNELTAIKKHPSTSIFKSSQKISSLMNLESLMNGRIQDAKDIIGLAKWFRSNSEFPLLQKFQLTEVPESLLEEDLHRKAELEEWSKVILSEITPQPRQPRCLECHIRLKRLFNSTIGLTQKHGNKIVALASGTVVGGLGYGLLAFTICHVVESYFQPR